MGKWNSGILKIGLAKCVKTFFESQVCYHEVQAQPANKLLANYEQQIFEVCLDSHEVDAARTRIRK